MTDRTVHLVRHGAPVRAGLLLGHCDEPCADPEGGLTQAMPGRLTVACIVSSDLQRASAGAQALATARGLALTVDARWRELDFGEWDGLPPERVPADALAQFWNDPETAPPPGGERWSSLRTRVANALAELPDNALVVTHGGTMRAAISVVTGLDFRQVWAVDLPYGALLSLRLWANLAPSGQVIRLRPGTEP